MSQVQHTTNGVLSQLLEPVERMMPIKFAEDLAAMRASPEVQDRVEELAEKCNEGKLTPEEKAEYEAYVDAIDVISLLQAKARAVLARQTSPSWMPPHDEA
jgi:ribosome maturation protein Sdo1